MASIDVVLFDQDGTLLDMEVYRKLYGPITSRLKDIHGQIEVENATRKAMIGDHVDTYYLAKELASLDVYFEMLEEHMNESKLLPNVEQVLDSVRKKCKVGIISNSHRRTMMQFMERHEIKADFIFSIDDGGEKGKKEFWKRLIRKHRLNPKRCLVVDDFPDYIRLAEECGFQTFQPGDIEEVLKIIHSSAK